jgi:hypothetical protein
MLRKAYPMPTIASSELPVPNSWDEFENICADLFGRIWNDHNVVRYGRMGQRQHGVDIRGQMPAGGSAGVQCKKKRRWPVAQSFAARWPDILEVVPGAELRQFAGDML